MKQVRIIWRNSLSNSPKGPKSNFGDVLKLSMAENDLRYQYIFCLDQKSKSLFENIFKKLKIITMDELKSSNYKNGHLYTIEDSIYTKEMVHIRNEFANKNLYTEIKIPSAYSINHPKDNISWQEMYANFLNINLNKIKYTYADASEKNYEAKNKIVGINYIVPEGWEAKRPSDKWILLLKEKLVSKKYNVSLQPKPSSIENYIAWVRSCENIITVEGLGLHIALALRKKVLLLSGPVKRTEYLVPNLKSVYVKNHKRCLICKSGKLFSPNCLCMDSIKIEDIIRNI